MESTDKVRPSVGTVAGAALKGYGAYQGLKGVASDLGGFATALKNGDGDGMLQHGFSAVLGGVNLASAFAQQCFAAGTPLRTPRGRSRSRSSRSAT